MMAEGFGAAALMLLLVELLTWLGLPYPGSLYVAMLVAFVAVRWRHLHAAFAAPLHEGLMPTVEVVVELERASKRLGVMTNSRVRGGVATLAAAAMCLAGCGSTDGVRAETTGPGVEATADALPSATSVAYTTETQKTRSERIDQMWISRRLIDYLPNVRIEGTPPLPVLHTVVVGEVVDAEEGTAFKLPEGDAPEGAPNDGQTEVPFDSAEADWQTIHAIVKVTQNLGRAQADSDLVTVGFAIDPTIDAERFMEGLRGLGRGVFFADSTNAVFDYADDVNGISGQGTMVATVTTDGTLALPFVSDALASQFLEDSPTLDALIDASQTPARTISWP